GPFRAPERRFWQADGVYTTAAGYAGECEAVRVVFDPAKTRYEALLGSFWEGHDPTAAASAAHRSAIYWGSESQRRVAEASRDAYQRALSAAGKGRIATEIAAAPEFRLADDAEQQFLAKNPGAHAPSASTGVRYPKGTP